MLRYSLLLVVVGMGLSACSRSTSSECPDDFRFERVGTAANSTPPARFDHAMVSDRDSGHIYMFGGRSAGGYLGDLWAFDAVHSRWSRVETESGPGPRSGASLVHDPETGRLVLFGGYFGTDLGEAKFLRDLWIFTPGQGWSREFFQTGPEGRAWHAATAVNGNMLLFGGYSGRSQYHRNDVWSLDLEELGFRRVATDGGPRMVGSPSLMALGDGNRFVVFGRDGTLRPKASGSWELVLREDRWTGPRTERAPGNDYSLAVANPWDLSFLVLRGPEDEGSDWRLWKARAESSDWCSLEVEPGPLASHGLGCAPDPKRDHAWICFGGVARHRVSGDTWRLAPEGDE
jgi:hypothetical protein